MKSFAFWFVVSLIAVTSLHNQRRRHDSDRDREPAERRSVVIRPAHAAHPELGELYRVEGERDHRAYPLASLRQRYGDRLVFAFGDDMGDDDFDRDHDRPRRVVVDGLPVPIVPGSRVTEARPEPPVPPAPPRAPAPPKKAKKPKHAAPPTPPKPPEPVPTVEVTGRLSATEDRARRDALEILERQLVEQLRPEVPADWKVPASLIRSMVRETKITPHERDYGRMYDATLVVDASPGRKASIIETYQREQVVKRLAVMGGGLLFVLACLGGVSGYIRADEATKGYYTNGLRLAALAGVGGAGAVIYQVLA